MTEIEQQGAFRPADFDVDPRVSEYVIDEIG
jgi:hypothetical protein